MGHDLPQSRTAWNRWVCRLPQPSGSPDTSLEQYIRSSGGWAPPVKLPAVARGDSRFRSAAPSAVERVRGARPEDDTWRADALAGSRHSRWIEELRQPLGSHDLQLARQTCARVTRIALQDYAPALLLLSDENRLRVQAITAYTLTLFDFVRQTGLEGERLAAINRWEFDLECALEGNPPGQPVFVLLADLERRRPWARAGFEHLHGFARRRSADRRPANRRAAEGEASMMASSLGWLLLGSQPPASVVGLAAGLVRLRALATLGDDLRRHRCRLPITEVAEDWHATEPGAAALQGPVATECGRIRHLLEPRDWLPHIPPELRRAVRYCQAAGLRLLRQTEERGATIVDRPPAIGPLSRLALLARCRW